ncbi:MAG: hypothetical protein K2J58_05895 [Muribaculaceae bacterium]|nr:hypothetical protein [Muribaculaceae bacterium]
MKTTILKRSIRSMLFGLLAVTAFPVMADTDTSSPATGDAVLTVKNEDTLRKRMPSRMILQLVYEDGRVSIYSDFFVGEFSLRFESQECGDNYYLPSIHVGESAPIQLEYGEYYLTAVAEDGTVLSGCLQIY